MTRWVQLQMVLFVSRHSINCVDISIGVKGRLYRSQDPSNRIQLLGGNIPLVLFLDSFPRKAAARDVPKGLIYGMGIFSEEGTGTRLMMYKTSEFVSLAVMNEWDRDIVASRYCRLWNKIRRTNWISYRDLNQITGLSLNFHLSRTWKQSSFGIGGGWTFLLPWYSYESNRCVCTSICSSFPVGGVNEWEL